MLTAWLMTAALALPGAGAATDDDGFTPLFNGKDFTGWVLPDDAKLFAVEDGEIVGRTNGDLKKNEFLVTDKPYGDFHLKLQVKVRNGNSGVQFRSKRAADGAVSGPQADAADGFWGLLYEERGRGILERYPEEQAKVLAHAGDWNDLEVIARGKHVQMFLNGTKVIDREDPEFAPEGIIALQVHVGPPMEVRFRKVHLKKL